MSLLDLRPSGVNPSPNIAYIKGGFDFDGTAVPFFSTCLQAGQLNSLLRLPSQIPVDPANPIMLDELFQRELDMDRVEQEIVPYLRSPNRLRFFNALTVVLLPADPANPRRIAREYPAHDLAPPSKEDLERTSVGPIVLSHLPDDPTVGYLAWNLDQTMPVVLDGQHRFRAMQMILNEAAGRLRDELYRAQVSVLFLIIDPRAGFKAPEGTTVLAACREIFIDVNKHARTVPRTRLFLLDDRDVVGVSMRAVIASGVAPEKQTVAERVAETGRIPLGLVDWRASTAKFDSTPYVTSLMTLHDIVEHIADVPRFDPLDYQKTRQAVEKLTARFDLESVPGFDSPRLLDEIDRAELDERPFELSPSTVEVAGEAFRERFGPRIVRSLTEIAPYAALTGALEDAGVLASALEPWLSFNRDERRALIDELNTDDPALAVERAWKPVKEAHPLAFQVVFQKAMLYSLNALLSWPEHVTKHLWPEGPETPDRLLPACIMRLNTTLVPSLATTGVDSAFLGAGIRPDGNIDFRKTRIRAITGFITYCLLAPIEDWSARYREDGAVDEQPIGDWVRERWAAIAPGPRDPIKGLFSANGKHWRNSVEEVVSVEAEATGTDLDEEQRAEARVAHAALQLTRVVIAAA